MNLKTYLMTRIVLIAGLCLVLTSAYVLWAGERESQRNSNKTLDLVARQLQAQLSKIAAGYDRLESLLQSSLGEQA